MQILEHVSGALHLMTTKLKSAGGIDSSPLPCAYGTCLSRWYAPLFLNLPLKRQVGELPLAGAYAVAWSPAGGYLQTFERPSRELGNAHKNLKVWSSVTHLHFLCCI